MLGRRSEAPSVYRAYKRCNIVQVMEFHGTSGRQRSGGLAPGYGEPYSPIMRIISQLAIPLPSDQLRSL
ncbi:hypothetical protein EMIT0P228_140113 [Pseudomonas brassicacearum]